ncbi:S53 family peptidase [Kibdelosporangium lantanae]
MLTAALPALLAATALPAAAAAPAAVAGDRPSWANTTLDQGATAAGATVDNVRVYLAGRDPAGLTAYAQAVSDPRDPNFRHFLTPEEVSRRFGASRDQTFGVVNWLESAGLTVTNVDQHYVSARGTVTQAERAFGTELHDFKDAGGTHRAPTGPVTVPANLAKSVLGVIGLTDPATAQVRPRTANKTASTATSKAAADPFGPPPAIYRAEPCSDYWGQKVATDRPPVNGQSPVWTPCGYGPQELRKAYGLDHIGMTGKGVTIGIIDPYASPTIEADLSAYYNKHNFQGLKPGQLKQYTVPPGSTVCYGSDPNVIYPEEALDIEAAHSMAPDADIAYIGAKDCEVPSMIDAVNRAVDGHLADMVSNSWGIGSEPPADAVRAAFEDAFQRAAVEGIGIYYSSGDGGYEDPLTPIGQADGSTRKQTNYPPESPWVTAVGGTNLGLDSTGKRVVETTWDVLRSSLNGSQWTPAPGAGYPGTFTGGSGGGTSIVHRQPSYQAGVVPDKLARALPDGSTAAQPMRVVPDISADADSSTGMKVGFTQLDVDGVARFHETRLGGTSLSCPLIVGIQALAQQAQGVPIGFANAQLYVRYGSPALRDIVDSQVSVARNDFSNPQDPSSSINARLYTAGSGTTPLKGVPGYDNATGLGVPGDEYVRSYGQRG